MGMDLSEFHEVFFEECFEGLDAMESTLLDLDGNSDPEIINTIFRAAHSIKGGAATFDFNDIASFTHVLETLLDQMRDGRRAVTREDVDLMLEAVDGLREMAVATRANDVINVDRVNDLKSRLERALENRPAAATEATSVVEAKLVQEPAPATTETAETPTPPTPAADVPAPTASVGSVEASVPVEPVRTAASGATVSLWRIEFRPHAHLLRTGNDPHRLFRELAKLGELKVECDVRSLPKLGEMDPEACYLAWNLELRGTVEEVAIKEVFAWVEGDCELSISRLAVEPAAALRPTATLSTGPAPAPAASPPASPPPSPAPIPGSGTAPPEANSDAKSDAAHARHTPQADTKPADTGGSAPASSDTGTKPSTPAPTSTRAPSRAAAGESGSIRVSIDKVDGLINLVGELVITQSMLSSFARDFDISQVDRLRDGLLELERNTRELQETAMQIRMLPISAAFNRFPRLVRDISQRLGKQVELHLTGEHTELDKTVLEKIGDPLVHLVRNSLDHGLETPDQRRANGKGPVGNLHLNAFHEGGNIVIQVVDDGAGLNVRKILEKARERGLVSDEEELSDEQVQNLIFKPGFSTADTVSDLSGRGVGMDVVRRNINDLGGTVSVSSTPGRGSVFTIKLPLTLAILDGQLVRLGEETYVVPLSTIIESLQVSPKDVHLVAGKDELFNMRDSYIPFIRLDEAFSTAREPTRLEDGLLVVVECDGRRIGLFVDELLGQQQVVIKSLEANFRVVPGLSGATILGDGTVALIIDVPGLVQRQLNDTNSRLTRAA
ncbi:MAG: chemotaxis protein CheA [Gammaproteobacteria bacterium]|nr:chemotaxis protein CheA [Gammaproteobacteria bacterium]